MDISESTNSLGPSSTAGTQGTEVSKSRNSLKLLKKIPVSLFCGCGKSSVIPSVSQTLPAVNAATLGIGQSYITSVISDFERKSSFSTANLEGSSGKLPSIRDLPASDSSLVKTTTEFIAFTEPPPNNFQSSTAVLSDQTSTAIQTASTAKRGNRRPRTGMTPTKFLDFTEPLSSNDFQSLLGILYTPTTTIAQILKPKNVRFDPFVEVKTPRHKKRFATRKNSLFPAPANLLSNKKQILRYQDKYRHREFICRDCNVFHTFLHRRRGHPCPAADPSAPACATMYVIGANQRPGRLFNHPFRFMEAQMAMKCHRLGLDHSAGLRAFNNSKARIGTHVDYVWCSETYAVSDRLLGRIQHFYHLSPGIKRPRDVSEMPGFCMRRGDYGGLMNLCRHLMGRCERREKGFVLWDFDDENRNPSVRRCDRCALEYRYDWYDVGDLGKGVVLSVWRDFGRCLTPFDPRWMAHFEEFEEPGYIARFKRDLGGLGVASSSKDERRWKEDMESAASS